jgi:midasin
VALDGQDESLLNMQKVEFEGERGEPKFRRYMDSFPFPYYVLVQQLESLPQLVSDLLKQWFELSAAS